MVKVSKVGLFLGEYTHNMTDRNRVALPKRIRVEIEGYEVILSRGFENCIYGFDRERWHHMANQQLSIQLNEEKGRQLRRQIFASAMILELDSQGRVVLPEVLLEHAGLKGKVGEPVAIIGAGDHFEMWEEGRWRSESEKLEG